MIWTENLTKVFKQRKEKKKGLLPKRKTGVTAVDHVSFEVDRGTVYGLIGANGAGKTTLVKVLSTLVLPTSGEAKVCGYSIIKEDRKVRASIGLATGTERSFYFRLSGWQNVWFFGVLQGMAHSELKRRMEELMKSLDIYSERDKQFMQYSLGEKRKLDLVRCLLTDPPVFFLDEPTTSIDPYSAIKIRDTVRELKERGKTILLVTHNLDEAEKLCDRVGIMDKGKLVKEGSLGFLKEEARTKRVSIALEEIPSQVLLDKFKVFGEVKSQKESKEIEILLSDGRRLSQLIDLVNSQDVRVESLNTHEPSLEQIFLKYTRSEKSGEA
ncbi:MAG: ABC transporter ATP-binding protein [Candidatus Zixiibacteriota bacterium]|nr:MAG: ABC transporter ATP-binding protein [candidate division Zixibacteria bacterium]